MCYLFEICLTTLRLAQTVASNDMLIADNEFGRMWKEAVVA
jgi:hypothetical protein